MAIYYGLKIEADLGKFTVSWSHSVDTYPPFYDVYFYVDYYDEAGNTIYSDSYVTEESDTDIVELPLDVSAGLVANKLYFRADSDWDAQSESWTVYDGALERGDLSFTGDAKNGILLGGYGNDTIRAGSNSAWIDGGAGNDKLYGGADGDLLNGAAGTDELRGGAGADTYVVSGGDKVFERAGEGSDLVLASTSYTLAAGQEIERLATTDAFATSAIKLYGNERSQTITGNAGSNTLEGRDGYDTLRGLDGGDTLRGGTGNDTLAGGLNGDTLTGGTGMDTFLFDTAIPANVDHITDFKPVDDTIRLENVIFTALAKTGTLSSAAFKDIAVAGAKVDADDRIIYDHDSGRLWYDADGSGSTAKVQFAILDNHPTITHADFLIV